MRTEFFVDYDLYDTTALQDAKESTESNSAFADISKIKENISAPNYGTLEHNFFVLDGSIEEFPDDPDNLVYFSKDFVQTNNDYPYAGTELYAGDDLDGAINEEFQKQTIVIDFTENHSSYGITLYFLNEYPTELGVEWFGLDGILKSRKRFYPDSLIYFCKNPVVDYGKIIITFMRALPYHYVKLQHIKYGTTITWGYDNIKSGKMVNDTDPISDKIKIDKLDFSFIDVSDEFNMGNADGLHTMLQKNQSMRPYEVVEGKTIILGTFFLDTFSTTKNVTKMSATDYKGKLANVDFMGGRMYDGEPAGNIIDEIMLSANIKDYTIDEETRNTPLYGTLKIQTCQKALREVLFASGSMINTALRTGVEIRKYDRTVTSKIDREHKFSTTYEVDNYVSDVTVKYKTWALDEKVSEITKGIYGVGTHTIQLSSPASNMTTNNGIILEQTPYYIVLNVTDEQREIIISGQKYVGEEIAATSSIEHLKSGEVRNTKTFSGTLINFEQAKNIADNILDYYQLQQIIQTKHLSSGEKSGDWLEIENSSWKYGNLVASVESMTTDLTGGFISTAKCRGYYKMTSEYYYADHEVYTGEDAII
ncbi:MAG: hypothetical protein NC094_12125 [Bacteroidales bacterium]|nr:hypothetical protein [Lachnoclostridium sp.]MCM1385257.1 hypothetical protein [Lachnoclostridium sp.]MCM1466157.1 hypothetical protein [Bacteroidales bacterium]